MSDPAACPFVIASAREVRVAHGVRRTVAASRAADAAAGATQLLADSADDDERAPGVVVGALAFNPHHAPQLFQPDAWHHPLPSSGAGYAVWPDRHAPAPRHWTVDAMPSRSGYERTVAAALEEMAQPSASPLRKVVLARTLLLHADAPINLAAVFARLSVDRAVHTFAVPLPPCQGGGRRVLIGATPELLAARHGGTVSSRPLAGSARRNADASADRDAAEGLARSDKDLREHVTVVEWIADRLAPYCRTLHVPKSPSLVSTASMWHLGSTIEGTLHDPAVSALELAVALHPTPAVCGAPFDRAAAFIDREEPFDRDFYSGAVGWSDVNGDGEWYVAIRCAEVCGPSARLFAGAGIVIGSNPADEAAETSGKFVALLRALGVDEEGRTFPGSEL